MWKNYFKLAFRNLLKRKTFTAIKIIGLTIGIASCLLIGLYLQHELSYDACHEKADRIVRTTMEFNFGGEVRHANVTGNLAAPTFKKDFPEVEEAIRVIRYNSVVKYEDQLFEEKDFFYTDEGFFDVFTFPLLTGKAKAPLQTPHQVIISEHIATKYFGKEDPIGKSLTVGNDKQYEVKGVMKNPPKNSQLKPHFLASFANLRDAKPERATWWNANYATYLLLNHPNDRLKLQDKIDPYMRAKAEEYGSTPESEDYLTFNFEPLRDVHLRSTLPGNFEPNGDIRYVYILIGIAFLILLIGGTTYVNLTTAAGTERAKEVGVQKVMGADRWQLFWQHLGEAIVVTTCSVIISFGVVAPLIPVFNRLFNRTLTWEPLMQPTALFSVLAFGLLISLLSGAYPAIVVSGFQPAKVLKGQFKFSSSGTWMRRTLIVLQFVISAFLIICTLVLQRQLNYVQNKKLGYNKDHIVVLPSDSRIVEKLDAFKSEFKQNSNVRTVSLAYETPTRIDGGYGIQKMDEGAANAPVTAIPVDEHFLETFEIEMVAGEPITKKDRELIKRMDSGEDTLSKTPILINEAQSAAFGWTPEEAINQTVQFNNQAIIKGVFKDFHFKSLHEPIGNLVIFPSNWGRDLMVKIEPQNMTATLAHLEDKWATLAPHRPFTYHFLDEEFAEMYQSEMQVGELVTAFSLLAIFLACLGLFGLASFSIVQRTKEIGIRKVLGASVTGIVGLLSKDFLKLVGVALVIAVPVAWLIMNNWLDNFAYRVNLEWWIFALAGVAAVLTAFLAVSFQSVKAALSNPIESLRSE